MEREREDPFRPVLPVLRALSAPTVPPLAWVEFEHVLVQRMRPLSWWALAVLAFTMLVLMAFGTGAEPWIVVVIALLIGGSMPWTVRVGDDELLIVGDRVYTDELASLPGKHALMPLPIAKRTFAIVWEPAPLPTSIDRHLRIALRMDLRIRGTSTAQLAAMIGLSRWQRRPSELASDLRRFALGPVREAVNRCGDETSLQADTLASELRVELAQVFTTWGLTLAGLAVQTLELVVADGKAPDRIRVLRPE
jgi:hypothetical protein